VAGVRVAGWIFVGFAADSTATRVGLSDGCDAGEDEVDAGQELLAVVVAGQLRRHLPHERILRGVKLRPPCGDGREERRSIRLAREQAGARGVLSGEAENVVQERGRAVELRSFGDAERLELSQNSASLAGAAISGAVIVAVGAGWAIGIDAATFGISAVLVLTSRAPRTGRGAQRTALFSELHEGWREFRSRQWVWVVVAQFALVNLCFSPCVYVLGPIVARQHWGGALAWSAVVTANAIGLVLGSFVAMRLRPAHPLLVATLATFGFLPPFFLLAAHASVWLAAVSMLVNGICADVFEVLWMTALQAHIPDDKLSRVTSYDALGSFVLGPLGLLAVGPVAAAAGIGTTLVAAGFLVTTGNVFALCTRSVRRLSAKPEAQPAITTSPLPLSLIIRAVWSARAIQSSFLDEFVLHFGGHRGDKEEYLVRDALCVGAVQTSADTGKDLEVDVPSMKLIFEQDQQFLHRAGSL
jgi:hypothetical protein